MRISYLEIRNYRKFRNLKLQLPDGVIGILGLNGAGKTTIIEAMAWCLFGNVDEVVRTNKESIRRLGAGPSETVMVALEFELDEVEYRLEREMGGRNLSMKATLRSRGEMLAEGDRAVKAKVLDLIGMDHKSFFTSIFARQKELNELQNFTPAERKKVVLRMLRIDSVDSVIQSVRDEKRGIAEMIKGAQMMIQDRDGRDLEDSIASELEDIKAKMDGAEKELRLAKENVRIISEKTDGLREKRDGLRGEVDGLNSVSAALDSRRSALAEQRDSRRRLEQGIRESEQLLSRLPELEEANRSWIEESRVKESLDRAKGLHDKREHIMSEMRTIERDINEARKSISGLEKKKAEEGDIQDKIARARKDRETSEEERGRLSKEVGELSARVSERKSGLEKDERRLHDIEEAGEKGACPTCERTLEEAYGLIVGKLGGALEAARKQLEKDEGRLAEVRSALTDVESKVKALDNKVRHQEEKLAEVRRTIVALATREEQIEAMKARLSGRNREVEKLGDFEYSAKEHERVKSSLVKLQKDHDRYVELGERRKVLATMKDELKGVQKSIAEGEASEKELAAKVEAARPKKALYEKAIKAHDEAQRELGAAKDAMSDLKVEADRAKAGMDALKKSLETVRAQKKTIGSQKAKAEELGTLEEALINFKGHLIGKVAPALAETTSEMIGLMTEGKYERVALDEDYQISVDEGGVLHPLDRFSGGEADLANLSLRLAISRVIAERASTSQMNFLILDEIFGSLDPNRKRSVMAALSGLSTQFRQVILISHVEDIKDLMTNVIRVEELPDGTSAAKIVS